jgi:hypothetical protein
MELYIQVQYYIPRYGITYPGTELHIQVQKYILQYVTSYPVMKLTKFSVINPTYTSVFSEFCAS